MNEKELDLIFEAIDIAANGTPEEKADFVAYASQAIGFCSANAAFDPEARAALSAWKKAYKAYLEALNPSIYIDGKKASRAELEAHKHYARARMINGVYYYETI